MDSATCLVWLELCTNPSLHLTDLRAVVGAVRASNPTCRCTGGAEQMEQGQVGVRAW